MVLTAICHGATVRWDVATIITPVGFNCSYGLLISLRDLGWEGNFAGYNIVKQPWGNVVLTGQNWESYVSYGHLWRQMNEGDLVDATSMIGDYNDYFFCLWNGHYNDVFKPLTINQGQTVYLGFVMDGMYGWVQLGYDGSGVYVVGSAIDIDGDPIRIGFVPEPSAALLALVGLAAFALRRRKAR